MGKRVRGEFVPLTLEEMKVKMMEQLEMKSLSVNDRLYQDSVKRMLARQELMQEWLPEIYKKWMLKAKLDDPDAMENEMGGVLKAMNSDINVAVDSVLHNMAENGLMTE